MKDFTPTESVQCTGWSAYAESCAINNIIDGDPRFEGIKSVPTIIASCQGTCKLTGLRWDAELVRAETGQEWMRLNFDPIDQADYPKLYAHLEAGIKSYHEPSKS